MSEMKIADRVAVADDPAVAFLLQREGALRGHSGGQLLDHLIGVERKLRGWGCSERLCRAGLFHSVYGTENYRHATVSLLERGSVRALIGSEAEGLAHDFHELKAREFLAGFPSSEETDGPPDVRQMDLLHLFVANWLEQLPRMKSLQRAAHMEQFRRLRKLLNPSAQMELQAAYGFEVERSSVFRSYDLEPGVGSQSRQTIRVIDDLVPPHLLLRLTALMQRNIWRYGWKAAQTQTAHGFWHSHFAGDNEDGDACCEHEIADRPLMAPILELWHLVRDALAPGHVPVRMYANGHTYGGDGHLHTDCERPGHFTTILYAHSEWEVNWAGETVFFDAEGRDVRHSVFPRPGRIVHFPGDIPHAARSPSRDCPALRAVIVIKSFRQNHIEARS